MAERQRVPRDYSVSAVASLRGVLAEQVHPAYSSASRQTTVEIVLEIGDADFHVLLAGDLAEQMAGVMPGTGIEVRGKLSQQNWKTRREAAERQRIVVRALTMEIQVEPSREETLVEGAI